MLPLGCFGADMGKLFSKSKSKQEMYASKYAYHGEDAGDEEDVRDFTQYPAVHSDAVTAVMAAPSSTSICLSASKDQNLVLFDFSSGKTLERWKGHEKEVTKVAYDAGSGSYFSASRDKLIHLWKRGQPSPTLTFTGHDLVVTGLSLNQDGSQVVTGSRDNTLRIWDVTSGRQIKQNSISRNLITHVKWSSVSNLIAQSGEDKEFRVFDGNSLQVTHTFPRKQHIQTCCDIQGSYCLTCSNGFGGNGCEATLWDLRMNRVVCEYKGHSETVASCMFLPSSQCDSRNLLATSSHDCSVKIWDQITKECVSTITLPGSGPLSSMSFHDDSSICVASFNSGIYVLKLVETPVGVLSLLKKAQF